MNVKNSQRNNNGLISVLRLYVSMVNIEYTNIRTWLVGSYNFSRNSLTHWRFFFLSRDDSFSISIYMGPLTLRFSTLSPTSIDHIENQTSSPPYAFDNCYFREWIWLDILVVCFYLHGRTSIEEPPTKSVGYYFAR